MGGRADVTNFKITHADCSHDKDRRQLVTNTCTRYVPLLPKPRELVQVGTLLGAKDSHSFSNRAPAHSADTSTQTDALGTALRFSNVVLEDQCTSTAFDLLLANQLPNHVTVSETGRSVAHPQCAQTGHSVSVNVPFYQHEQNVLVGQPWNRISDVPRQQFHEIRSSCSGPHYDSFSNLGTQTSHVESQMARRASISNLGTQTTLSALLREVNPSSSSIELQCDLGNASLLGVEDMSTIEQAMSFGTQTNLMSPTQHGPVMSRSTSLCIGTDIPSFSTQTFGTQTTSETDDVATAAQHGDIAQSFPLQHSTSDFAMQFPYELMDFGTQTPVPDTAHDFTSAFMFDDDLLTESASSTGAQLSQSSTQTDLEFLFNNIETQTDWQI